MGFPLRQIVAVPSPKLTEKNLGDQTGRVFIVTGGYAGVGYELSKILYEHNGTVYVAGRNENKANIAIAKLKKASGSSAGRLLFLKLDLADLTGIRQSAQDFMSRETRLDVLVNNAGVMTPPAGSKTVQGYELQIGTNCLGPYLFTKSLLPVLQRTAEVSQPSSVRVLWAGSIVIDLQAPRNGVVFESNGQPKVHGQPEIDYAQSKAGNALLSGQFTKQFKDDGIVSVSFNPGNLNTELQRHWGGVRKAVMGAMLYPAINGAYTELYAGWSDDIKLKDSGYYVIPWGRIGRLRDDIQGGLVDDDKGSTSISKRFWDWCEAEVSKYN